MAGKALPPSGGGFDPKFKALLDKLSERVDVLSDHRGDPLDRALTPRDLLDLGLAKRIGRAAQRLVSGSNLVATTGPGSSAIPPAPTGFTVTGGLEHIFLEWDNARQAYGNHGYTAIFRNTVDNLANALEVGQTSSSFNHADLDVNYGVDYYYWIRFVSTANVMGPPNSPVGTLGKLSEDPTELLARLNGEIDRTHLNSILRAELDNFEDDIAALEDLYGDTANAAQSAADAALSAAAAIQAEAAALQARNEAIVAAGNSLTQANAATSSATEAATALSNATIKANEAASSASSASGSASSASSSAIAASNSAIAAGDSASASSSSANSASTSATAAGTAAAAANQSKLDAQTALSGAQAAQSAAVTAKNDAAGSASAASSSASLAVNAKNDAAGSASAASTSASNAASSASAAATNAFFAQTYKGLAETAAGNAQTYATNAGTSETNAAGSASSASTSAGAAATSALAASGSATAAAGSATTASTKASEASTSSSAANTARVAAESARDSAAGSASAAATSASTASTHASDAATSASSANTSAATATTKAGEALTYRNQAATSESNAAGYAAASAVDYSAITARLNNVGGVTIEQKFAAQASSITGLSAQYTVKVDNNGHITGFGLASSSVNGQTVGDFIVNADRFFIARPGVATGEISPFVVDTSPAPGFPNGRVVMDGAFIKNATINDLQVGGVTAGKITGLRASFITVDAGEANIDQGNVSQGIQSSNYSAGSAGWKIHNNGDAEFNDLTARGTLRSSNYSAGNAGWQIQKSGAAEFNGVVITRANVVADGVYTPPPGYQFDIFFNESASTYEDHVYRDGNTLSQPVSGWVGPNQWTEFLIETTYDDFDDLSNLYSASFSARAQVLSVGTIASSPPPSDSISCSTYAVCEILPRQYHSPSGIAPSGFDFSLRRIFLRVRVYLNNIRPEVEAIRIQQIKWVLHRLT